MECLGFRVRVFAVRLSDLSGFFGVHLQPCFEEDPNPHQTQPPKPEASVPSREPLLLDLIAADGPPHLNPASKPLKFSKLGSLLLGICKGLYKGTIRVLYG